MDIALFSPASLFSDEDDTSIGGESKEAQQSYVERKHEFSGIELSIREFSFHQLNANLLWAGTFAFAEWLVQHRSWIEGRRVIELGSGTGALAIFLRKVYNLDITTSDYEDQDIEDNIAHNCMVNGITPVLPHIKHVKQYSNLIKTISFLLKFYKPMNNTELVSKIENEQNGGADVKFLQPAFIMSWRRRIGKEDESLFFAGCEKAGLDAQHIGSRVYCIKPSEI